MDIPKQAYEIILKTQNPEFNESKPFFEHFYRAKTSTYEIALLETRKMIQGIEVLKRFDCLPAPYPHLLQEIVEEIRRNSSEEISTNDIIPILVQRLHLSFTRIKKHLDGLEEMYARLEFR